MRAKCCRKLAAVPNPHRSATRSIELSVVSRRRWARSTRWPSSHWWGVVPVTARKRRAKCLGLMAARYG